MTAPSIIEVYPVNGAEGVVLSDTIYVVFDQEVDTTSVEIFLEGPDTDRWSGPDQARWDNPNTDADDDVLASPGYKGIVPGSLSFEKVDEDGNGISALDYTGGGSLWRSKVVFTPTRPLSANTEYRIWIVGDEETGDSIVSGVSSRTVFDPAKGSNLGDGEATFSGGYIGSRPEDIYYIRIKETGSASDKILFQWWKASSPLVVRQLNTRENSQLLNEGVFVKFSGDFEEDDEFSVHVKSGERMQNTYTWVFTTGAGSIETVPSSSSEGAAVPAAGWDGLGAASGASGLRVLEITPASRATNLDPLSIETIVVKFSANLDEDTITDDTVQVWSEPVNGDPQFEAQGELVKTLSISGDTLTIQIS